MGLKIFIVFTLKKEEICMVGLRCKRFDCKYNKNFNCEARNIMVTEHACCKTFEKDKHKTEAPQNLVPQKMLQRNTDISCESACIFNEEGKCIANGITIIEKAKAPHCVSFMPK